MRTCRFRGVSGSFEREGSVVPLVFLLLFPSFVTSTCTLVENSAEDVLASVAVFTEALFRTTLPDSFPSLRSVVRRIASLFTFSSTRFVILFRAELKTPSMASCSAFFTPSVFDLSSSCFKSAPRSLQTSPVKINAFDSSSCFVLHLRELLNFVDDTKSEGASANFTFRKTTT